MPEVWVSLPEVIWTTRYPPLRRKPMYTAPKITVKMMGRRATELRAARAPKLSNLDPIIGSTRPTESMPAPPMMPKSSAPPRGNNSDVTPNIVGQKNVFPTPNTVAARKATKTDVPACMLPSAKRPPADKAHHKVRAAKGENLCTKPLKKNRNPNISPAA